MSPIPIDFVAHGGRDQGLGHIVRSARHAAEAIDRGWRVRGWVEGDDAALAVWARTCGRPARPLREAHEAFAPIVAVDGPDDKRALLGRLGEIGARPLLIDDERAYARRPNAPRGWRLLPGLHHAPVDTSGATDASGFALLAGPRFAILSDAHRFAPEPTRAERSSLLVSLGGSDPHRAGPRVALGALEALGTLAHRDEIEMPDRVDVVFGPCFVDDDAREARALRDAGCFVHHALDASGMSDRMQQARLALIGFGTSVTELAWHGTPFLTLTHRERDRGPARNLEARGYGRVLGSAQRLDRVPIAKRVRRALLDGLWQEESARAARLAVGDARGASRLFDRIESDLALRSARGSALPERAADAAAVQAGGMA
ncbi:MAG: hypothetical protein AAGC67_11590 [Myxococcota bacterium]